MDYIDSNIDLDVAFGLILKKYRTDAQLTQGQLGEKIGISLKYISRIENGGGGISKETLIKIMNVFGVTPNQMFKDFILNPKVKAKIRFEEEMVGLSDAKLEILVQIAHLLRNLK